MTNSSPIVEAEVAEYLKKHPDFFSNHLDILTALNLPHQSGQAVSLVERQMQALRKNNNDLKARFNQLMDVAKLNESHFENTKLLIIDLLDCHLNQGDLSDLSKAFNNHFPKALAANEHRIILIDCINQNEQQNLPKNMVLQTSKAIQEHLPKFLNMDKSFCGALIKTEKEFLFGDQADLIASCAIIPLQHQNFSGLIAIGNFKEKHFHKGMGTMFLDYIGDVVARVLHDQLNKESQQSIAI